MTRVKEKWKMANHTHYKGCNRKSTRERKLARQDKKTRQDLVTMEDKN